MVNSKWCIVKYFVYGTILYAVENEFNYVYKYCGTKERAQEVIDNLQ